MSSKRHAKQIEKEAQKLKREQESEDSEDDGDFDDEESPASESAEDPEEEERQQKRQVKARAGRKRTYNEAQKAAKKAASRFVDVEADEDDDEEDIRTGDKKDFYYDQKDLARKNQQLNLDEMGRRFQQIEQEKDEDEEEYDEEDELAQDLPEEVKMRSKLPAPTDPKLWQVRVKKNFEKIAVMALLNKSIDFAQRGRPLSILSVTSVDSTEGYIFVEAFKEIHVKEACKNLHFILNQFILLPTDQMPSVYQNDKAKNNEIKQHQWVRIKQGGAYNGDIGMVETNQDSKIWIRLIPRIEPLGAPEKRNGKTFFRRIPQKLGLRPKNFPGAELASARHYVLRKNMWTIRNQLFYHGFVFKSFTLKQIETGPNIKPTFEELKNFQQCLQNAVGDDDDDDNDELDADDKKIKRVIERTMLQGGNSVYMKGDKIRVNKGECTGMRGTVIEIDNGMVTFKALDLPELDLQSMGMADLLQVDLAHVSKYFEPGDFVRITEGKYKGETGQVIDVDGFKVSMMLDQSQHEIPIFANHLKLKSDTDQLIGESALGSSANSRPSFKAGELILYNGSKNAGLVLQVHEDYLKMINEQSKTVNIKIVDLGKPVPVPPRNGTLNVRDKNNNPLAMDQVVKVVDGPMKGLNGTIRHGYRHYLFLWNNKEFVQSNGIFVQNSKNTEILGAEFMKESQGQAIANQNRLVRDPLFGKQVVIISGKFKGHRGRVTYADDKSAQVELSSQCKKIPIDKQHVKCEDELEQGHQANADGRSVIGGQSMHGGVTQYEGNKTGAMGKHTPSHYPRSMWGGDNDYDMGNDVGGAQDFMRVQGSEHYPNQDFYSTGQMAGGDNRYKRERDNN